MGNTNKISILKPQVLQLRNYTLPKSVRIVTDSDIILLWIYWFQFAASLSCCLYRNLIFLWRFRNALWYTIVQRLRLCVCTSCCVLCAAQIPCRNVNLHCCRTRYVCTGNALCMNSDVSVKAYFSCLHISPFYWSVIVLSFRFVQNPYVLFSSAGPSSPVVLTIFVVSSYPVFSQSMAVFFFALSSTELV